MNKKILSLLLSIVALLGAFMGSQPAGAKSQYDEGVIAHGKYIATIAGCTTCHTPYKSDYSDFKNLTLDQIRTLAFNDQEASDQTKLLGGGRPFDLGPAGVVFSKNITPDTSNGIGNWTDEQVRVAVKTGSDWTGHTLFPVMPYHVFNSMADADLEAVIAYLRSVRAVSNMPPADTVSKDGLQPIPDQTGIIAPDPSDKAARGAYLVNSVMACTDCHTPIDANTGAPLMDKYLAGGQPYEGPWGIVYGGNITPDPDTGLGTWSESDIKKALTTGVRPDGRRLILMPWFIYAQLSPADLDAIVYYLKNEMKPVYNEVPKSSPNPDFVVMAPDEKTQPKPVKSNFLDQPIALVVAGVIVIAVISLGLFILRRKSGQAHD